MARSPAGVMGTLLFILPSYVLASDPVPPGPAPTGRYIHECTDATYDLVLKLQAELDDGITPTEEDRARFYHWATTHFPAALLSKRLANLRADLENTAVLCGLFPCDVRKFHSAQERRQKTRLHLIASFPDCRECENTRAKISETALNAQTLVFVEEGREFSRRFAFASGLEDRFLFHLSRIYSLLEEWMAQESHAHLAARRSELIGQLFDIWDHDKMAQAWKSPTKDDSLLDDFFAARARDNSRAFAEKWSHSLQNLNTQQFRSLVLQTVTLQETAYRQAQYDLSYRALDFKALRDAVSAPSPERAQTIHRIFDLELRSVVFGRHLLQLYCRAAARGLDLWARVGIERLPGVYNYLQKAVTQSGRTTPFLRLDAGVLTHANFHDYKNRAVGREKENLAELEKLIESAQTQEQRR